MAVEHLERLRRMLEQVGSAEPSPALESLKSRAVKSEGPVLDSRHVRASGMEAEFALESLDVLRQGSEIDADQRFALEAIVMPYYRPVVDVFKNQMKREQLTKKWEHLATDQLRPHIERCFLSVGRINVPSLPSLPYAGTGFIVGPDLMMTNRHVAQIFAQGIGTRQLVFQAGQSAIVDFYHENGCTQSEQLDVECVVMIHPYWDMALLKVRGLQEGRLPLALGIADPVDLIDREVVVIGYPGYDPGGDAEFQRIQDRIFRSTYYVKRMQPGTLRVRRPVESYHRQVQAVTHDSSTLGGNSGSLVVVLPKPGENPGPKGLHVVGLHFAGEYLVANYAVPILDLAQDSRIVDAGVNFVGRIEPRGDFYGPYWDEVDVEAAPTARIPFGRITPPAPPAAGQQPQPVASSTNTSWTIPIEVSITVGQPVPRVAPTAAGEVQRVPVEGIFGQQSPIRTSALPYPFSAASLEETRFSWSTALSLALASRLAYETAAAVQTVARDLWLLEGCQFIEADDTQCFIASTPNNVLIAFRGTESIGDWLANLNTASRSRSYGVVHRGFLNAFQVVEHQLAEVLEALPNRSLLLTGHSLGGALATIAAAEWHQRYQVRSIMTFGQPAVGKNGFEQFMQRCAASFFRFVNNDDVVPRVPPNYRHVGRLIRFDASGNVLAGLESPAPLIDQQMLTEAEFDSMRAALLQQRVQRHGVGRASLETPVAEGLLPSLSDHRLDAYIEKVAKHIKAAQPVV